MKNYFKKLTITIRGDRIKIPQYKDISPIIYTVLFIAGGFGIVKTFYIFNKVETSINPKTVEKITEYKAPVYEINEYKDIIKRNLFNIEGTVPDVDSNEDSNSCTTESRQSSLAYKVTGIIYGGDAKTSVVLMEQNKDNKQLVYKLGDSILPGIILSNIEENKVYFTSSNTASCPEYLELKFPSIPTNTRKIGQASASQASYAENGFERVGNDTNVTKQWVNDVLNNKLSTVLEEARAVPNLVGGQVKGFTISQIIPNSVYSKLGLQNGDVISSINGIELNDAARAIQTLQSLRSESKIELNVLRNGQSVSLKVSIQ
jgi:general secretion pathway protein C